MKNTISVRNHHEIASYLAGARRCLDNASKLMMGAKPVDKTLALERKVRELSIFMEELLIREHGVRAPRAYDDDRICPF